jgi:hypothetical protein
MRPAIVCLVPAFWGLLSISSCSPQPEKERKEPVPAITRVNWGMVEGKPVSYTEETIEAARYLNLESGGLEAKKIDIDL